MDTEDKFKVRQACIIATLSLDYSFFGVKGLLKDAQAIHDWITGDQGTTAVEKCYADAGRDNWRATARCKEN